MGSRESCFSPSSSFTGHEATPSGKWSVSLIIRAAFSHSAHNDRDYCCIWLHHGFRHHSPSGGEGDHASSEFFILCFGTMASKEKKFNHSRQLRINTKLATLGTKLEEITSQVECILDQHLIAVAEGQEKLPNPSRPPLTSGRYRLGTTPQNYQPPNWSHISPLAGTD